jgi:hypothetical protein
MALCGGQEEKEGERGYGDRGERREEGIERERRGK